MMILAWNENLPEDEMPPKEVWYDEKKLERHFQNIKDKRKRKWGNEAEEGTLDDAQGKNVTLRNKLLDRYLDAQTDVADDYMEI